MRKRGTNTHGSRWGHAMSNTAQGGMIGNNAIVALGCIIGTVCKGSTREGSNFRLENSEEWRVSGSAARTCTIGSTIDSITTFGGYHHTFEPNAEDGREISFVQVDNSKTVKFEVVGFFWNHGGYNLVPALKRVTSASTKIEER